MSTTWLMDETYVKILGTWHYLYRGVDGDGQVLDCGLSVTSCGCRRSGHRAPVDAATSARTTSPASSIDWVRPDKDLSGSGRAGPRRDWAPTHDNVREPGERPRPQGATAHGRCRRLAMRRGPKKAMAAVNHSICASRTTFWLIYEHPSRILARRMPISANGNSGSRHHFGNFVLRR